MLEPMKADVDGALKSWEFPKNSKIKIREVLNYHNGEIFGASYMVTVPARVTGTVRRRRQFKDRVDAESWAAEELRGAQKQGEDYFKASPEERREFVEMIPLLREKGLGLREVVEFAVPRLRPPGGEQTVAGIVAEMISSKEIREARGGLRERSVSDFKGRAGRFAEHFGDILLRDLICEEIKEWLRSLELSPRSTQNYMAVVNEVLGHAQQRKLIVDNPLDALTDMDRKELIGDGENAREPGIFAVADAQKLLNAAADGEDWEMLSVLTLGLFCGLRTEEIKRLDWKDVHLEDDSPFVSVGAEIAKKRRIRNVDIPLNAVEWLTVCRKNQGAVTGTRYKCYLYRKIHSLLERAGIGIRDADGNLKTQWESNGMRHSFGSYHYALHGNSIETARLLGHKSNDEVLFSHYRRLAKKSDGERYFAIRPEGNASRVVAFAG